MLFYLWIYILFYYSRADLNTTEQYKTRQISHSSHRKTIIYPGKRDLIQSLSIHGAVIMSDWNEYNSRSINGFKPFPKNNTNIKTLDKDLLLISARIHNVHKLMNELPFPLTEWSAVVTDPCPLWHNGHKAERGLLWAHYRILREFIYFDPIILSQINDKNGKRIKKLNQTISSNDGLYIVYQNGTMFKNHSPYQDNDILVIFEDDAESVIQNLNTTLLEELSSMNTDLLYLGWCEGRLAKPVPLCTHAYAVSRKGAMKLIRYIEPCGLALGLVD